MPEIIRPVNVDVPGFEKVVIHYNVMASRGQSLALRRSFDQEDAENIIMGVDNWPAEYGEGIWADECPLVVISWICITGPQVAVSHWLRDPNSSTA